MGRGKYTFLIVVVLSFNVFAQSEPIAGVDVMNKKRTTLATSNSQFNDQYNSLDAIIHVIPWKKEINTIMNVIDRNHFKPRTLEQLNQVLVNGTLNSFDQYPNVSQDERDYLKVKFRAYYKQHPLSSTDPHLSRNEETHQIEVNESYLTWLEEHVFRHSKVREIFQREKEVYKYAALLSGIARMLDPNSWFAFDEKSYTRASNLIDGKSSIPAEQVSCCERNSIGNAFTQNHSFGKVNLNDRVLWVRFIKELGNDAGDSLLTILSEYKNSYDSVVYDFRQTLGGTRPEFEHLLEPFVALDGQDILMASFFDRHGYESLVERMLIRHQASDERMWQQETLNKPLLVYTSPFSSSGAEIVAMAVQDLGLGIVVGQKSSGKMTAAESYMVGPLAFWLTEYKFFGPKGNSPKGIKPDLELYLEDENDYIRNYDKLFAIVNPKNLSKDTLAGVYNSANLLNLMELENFKQETTALQDAIEAGFFQNKTFKKLLNNKDTQQSDVINFIARTLGQYCIRDGLANSCDIPSIQNTVKEYVQ